MIKKEYLFLLAIASTIQGAEQGRQRTETTHYDTLPISGSKLRKIRSGDYGKSFLVDRAREAIKNDDIDTLKQLIKSDPDFFERQLALLTIAARFHSPEVIEALMDNLPYFDINQKHGEIGHTLLMKAIVRKDADGTEAVRVILNRAGQDVNTKDSLNNTALHILGDEWRVATRYPRSYQGFMSNAKARLEMLLAVPNIKVNAENDYQKAPLQIALEAEWDEGVRQLTEHPEIELTKVPANVWTTACKQADADKDTFPHIGAACESYKKLTDDKDDDDWELVDNPQRD